MNIFDKYYDLEVKIAELQAQKEEIKPAILKEIKKTEKGIALPYGTFTKVILKTWEYTANLQREEAIAERQIKDLKEEISKKKEKARINGRAKSTEEITFRFSIKK